MHKKKGIIFKMERKTSGKKKGGDTAKHHDISMSSPCPCLSGYLYHTAASYGLNPIVPFCGLAVSS